MMRLAGCLLAVTALQGAQGPRIFIVTDMEGVGDVHNWDEQATVGQRRFEESRRLLTAEVNAAIQGALEAGAAEVAVWDGHGGSRALSVEDLHANARLIQGPRTPADFYLAEKRYEGIVFVGQHAKAGTANGLMAHSQNLTVKDITINGRSVGELGQAAAIAGHFKIPAIMLTGDQAACDEMLTLQPKAETVAVKQFIGRGSALSLAHSDAKALIRDAARRAVARIREFQPWIVEGPVEMRFEYLPDKAGAVPPARVYRGQTVLESFEQWLGKR
jgi:D-amino peptidase